MRILIIGSGGHAKVVIEACELQGEYEIAGLIDDFAEVGEEVLGYKVLGKVQDVKAIMEETGAETVFIAVGDNFQRLKIWRTILTILQLSDLPKCVIVHPSAAVSKSALLYNGVFVGASASINAEAEVYRGSIINTGAIVEHNCHLEGWNSLAPNATIGGMSSIGLLTHIGVSASINNKVKIGSNSVIGSGSVVTSAIPDKCVAYGVPCKFIHQRSEGEPYL